MTGIKKVNPMSDQRALNAESRAMGNQSKAVMLNLSVVVLAKNVEHLIQDCLQAIRLNNPSEVIVVDGESTDSTVQKAAPFADRVISDEGKGFSYARQIGLEAARKDHIAYVGPDNIIPKGCLESLLTELKESRYVGIQGQVRVLLDEKSTYWDRCWNEYFELTHPPGEQVVIGTPAIFTRKILLDFGYDPRVVSTDDTDVCQRLRQRGYKVGVGTTLAYERQRLTFRGFYRRWRWYGVGDARFVYKYRKTPLVSLRHFFHPLRTYIFGLSWKSARRGRVTSIPFFILCGIFRYMGFFLDIPRVLLRGLTKDR